MRRRSGAVVSLLLLASLVPATRVDAAVSRANLQAEVGGLTTEISTLDEDYNDARIKLSAAERQMRELEIAKEDANRELAALRRTASQRADIGGGNMLDASTYGRPVAVRSTNRRGYVGAGRPGV